MTTETKEKATRTPRDYSSIEKGALSLDLKERVELKNKLVKSIDDEVQLLEAKLAAAKLIVDRKSVPANGSDDENSYNAK